MRGRISRTSGNLWPRNSSSAWVFLSRRAIRTQSRRAQGAGGSRIRGQAAGWVSQVLASTEAAGLDPAFSRRLRRIPASKRFRQARLDSWRAGATRSSRSAGGAIDYAKAIGVVSANGGNIRDFIGVDNVGQPMPPTICIPTTAGTSADVSKFAVLSDQQEKRKVLIINKAVVPDIALIDPATGHHEFVSTACTGIDALSMP